MAAVAWWTPDLRVGRHYLSDVCFLLDGPGSVLMVLPSHATRQLKIDTLIMLRLFSVFFLVRRLLGHT